jgi:hypothetical protein
VNSTCPKRLILTVSPSSIPLLDGLTSIMCPVVPFTTSGVHRNAWTGPLALQG